MEIGSGTQVTEGNIYERVNTQRTKTALINETTTAVYYSLLLEDKTPKYTFEIGLGPVCEDLHISEPLDISFPDCNEEEENTHKGTLQSSVSRNPEPFLKVTFPQSHKITQK